MKVKRTSAYLSLALAGAMALTACGSDNNASNTTARQGNGQTPVAGGCSGGSLTGAGSSFQAPMEAQWVQGFPCTGAQVNYQSVGSGAGIAQFGQGTVDYAGSDVLMKADEQAAADKRCGNAAIAIPVTAGGVAVTYNLDGVSSLKLSPQVIADIFQGSVKQWNASQIKQLNPTVNLPSTPITVFHRSDDSGTTAVFSSYLQTAAGSIWKLGSDKSLSWPVGQGAKGNEGVSGGVQQTKGGITYTEQAYAEQNSLPTALIRNGNGAYVKLTAGNVSTALQAAKVTGSGHNVALQMDYSPKSSTAYPISTVSYVIVCSGYHDAGKAKLLKQYLRYAVTDGQSQAEKNGFAPLPQSLVTKDEQAVDSIAGS